MDGENGSRRALRCGRRVRASRLGGAAIAGGDKHVSIATVLGDGVESGERREDSNDNECLTRRLSRVDAGQSAVTPSGQSRQNAIDDAIRNRQVQLFAEVCPVVNVRPAGS